MIFMDFFFKQFLVSQLFLLHLSPISCFISLSSSPFRLYKYTKGDTGECDLSTWFMPPEAQLSLLLLSLSHKPLFIYIQDIIDRPIRLARFSFSSLLHFYISPSFFSFLFFSSFLLSNDYFRMIFYYLYDYSLFGWLILFCCLMRSSVAQSIHQLHSIYLHPSIHNPPQYRAEYQL